MVKVNDLLDQLTELKTKGYGTTPVISVHGSSGEYSPVQGFHTSEVEEGDEDLLELPVGTEFVCLYTGN